MTVDIKVGCVVVLYNPDLRVLANIKSYPYSIDEIILVDNSTRNNESMFSEIISDRIHYVPMMDNTGIAHAMNCGIKKLNEGIQYVITMDQDSEITDSAISVYRRYILSHEGMYVLTPQYNTDRNHVEVKEGTKRIELSMQSGTLFPVSIFHEIGYFDEQLFIDVVDLEYFLRMKKNGIPLIRCNEAVMKHHPAETRSKVILGRKIKYGIASPVRYYYQARNLYWVAKEYHSIALYKTILIKWAKIELLFENKPEYKREFYKGIQHAKTGRLGRYEK